MKRILMLAGLLVSSVVVQASRTYNATSASTGGMSGNRKAPALRLNGSMMSPTVFAKAVGTSVNNSFTSRQLIEMIRLFSPEYVKNNTMEFLTQVLPYLTINRGILTWYRTAGTNIMSWPRQELSKCAKGTIVFDMDKNMFSCSKQFAMANTYNKATSMSNRIGSYFDNNRKRLKPFFDPANFGKLLVGTAINNMSLNTTTGMIEYLSNNGQIITVAANACIRYDGKLAFDETATPMFYCVNAVGDQVGSPMVTTTALPTYR